MRKKLLMLFATACLVCVSAFGVTACGEEPHTHTYDKQVVSSDYLSTEATCTEKAKYFYSCECGEKGTEVFENGEALGHSYGNWTSNGNGTHLGTCATDNTHTVTENCNGGTATCTQKAKCKDCGAEYGDLGNHVFDQKNTDNKYLKSEATCTAKAVYYYSCACGEKGTETFENGDPLNHNHETLKKDANGHWYECACGDKTTAEAHIPGAAATETTPQTCTVCGYEIAPIIGHVHTAHLTKVDAKAQSCTAEGNIEYYTCSCGKWYTDNTATTEITDKTSVVIAKDNHSHETMKFNATEHWYECACGDKTTAEAHIPGAPATETTPQKCTVCEYEIAPILGHEHNEHLTKVDAKAQSCTVEGNIEYYTCSCGKWFEDNTATKEITDKTTVVIAKDNHNHETLIGNETEHWYECSCGDKTTAEEHNFATAKKDSTSHWDECVCGAKANVEEHNFATVNKDADNHWYECTCGEKTTAEAHSYDELKYDANYHWNECLCGDKANEEIHKDGTPTCEEQGTCSVCEQKYGNVLGHSYGNWTSNGDDTHTGTCANNCGIPATEDCHGGNATCEGKPVCDDCGTEYGEALGHEYGNWTSNGDGTHTGTCANNCGIPKTENCNFVDGECEHCGEVYTINYYVGGSENVTEVEVKLDDEITVYASAYGETLTPELSILSGEAVSVEDNKVTAIAVGTATVKATYTINGDTVEKEYTITVSYEKWAGEHIKYSTLDSKVYIDNELLGKGVVKVVDATDESIVYYDGSTVSNIPANTDSSDLTDYTKNAIIELADGSKYAIDAISYTKVIMEEEDLACLVTTGGVSSALALVKGYYILGQDIIHDDWVGNATRYSGFTGTFDGDGHYIDLMVGKYGLFSAIGGGAVIKNVAFVVNNSASTNNRYILSADTPGYNQPGYIYNGAPVTINDVYVDVNVSPYSGGTSTTIMGGQYQYYVNTNNFIFDFASGIKTFSTGAHAYNGVLAGYLNPSHSGPVSGTDLNEDGKDDIGYNRTNHSNTYYINSDYPYIFAHVSSTANVIASAMVAKNDITSYKQALIDFASSTSAEIGWVNGISRYADYTAMAEAGLDLSSFDNGLWDITTKGFPIFKSLKNQILTELVSSTEFSFAGSTDATETSIDSIESASVDLFAIYNEVQYAPKSIEIEGKEGIITYNISADKATISSVVNTFGQAIVKATYEIDGANIVKTYIVNVNAEAIEGAIILSSLDESIFTPSVTELEGRTIQKISGLDGTVYFDNSLEENKLNQSIKNLDSSDLTDYTKDVVITLDNGSNYGTTLISYTKVLTTDDDFAVFKAANGAEVKGYYILGNDIKLDSWTGNTCSNSNPHIFKGVFDGNGHYAEIALDNYGIFGTANGATIKNTAFIVKQLGTKDFAYASILGYSIHNTTVSNCYFEYDLPEGTTIDVNYSGWGQSSGFGVYASSSANVKFTNVVINTSKAELANTENAFAYGALMSKADNSQSGAYITKTTDVYVIGTNKYLGYRTSSSPTPGSTSGSLAGITGIAGVWFAENDTEAYNAQKDYDGVTELADTVKKQIAGTKRYDSVDAFAKAQGNDYTTFDSSIWDTTAKGFPIFKSFKNDILAELVSSSTEFSFAGSTDATETSFDSAVSSSADLFATYNEVQYAPKSIEIEGKEGIITYNISADKATISNVVSAFGQATVKATYEIDGVEVVKTYVVNVTIESIEGTVMLSSLDESIFAPSATELEGRTIEKISALDGTVYFDNSLEENKVNESIKNLDSKDLTDYTKDVVITLDNGSNYITNLISYTKVLTKADDLSVFAHANTTDVVSGYYIVANDITLEGSTWAGNAHYRTWQVAGTFDGVFDGNGHSVELKLNYGGLLGVMAPGSVVKDVAFIVKAMNTTGSNAGNVIANKTTATNANKLIVENVYVEWDLPENTVLNTAHNGSGQDFGLALFGEQPYYSKISNVVIDMTGVTKQTGSLDFRYGALYAKINSAAGATWADNVLSNVYVISQDKYFALNRTYTGATVNDVYAAVHFAGNDTEALAEFKTANSTVEKAFAYSSVKRYDSVDAFAKATGNDYSLFTGVWDTTLGYPVFKALKK